MKHIVIAIAVLLSCLACARAVPLNIPVTSQTNLQGVTSAGLNGSVYNFTAAVGPAYSVPALLAPGNPFGTTQVGSYIAHTTAGISYGTPDSDDSQALATWLKSDGATLVYSAPHITPVFDQPANKGTLLALNGFIVVRPSSVNVVQTIALGLDDGGLLTINGATVIDNGGIHGAAIVTQQIVFTAAGVYPVSLVYYDGHATQAVLTASLTGLNFFTTPLGNIPLDPTSTEIQNTINQVFVNTAPDPIFTNATTALGNLAISGASPAVYEAALRELSPLKYAALDSQALGAVDFITNDLDDYLAHRRDDVGTFRPGNGLDLSGLNVMSGGIDPGLQDVAGHLLAYNQPRGDAKELSDSGSSLYTAKAEPDQRWNVFSRGIVVLSQNLSGDGVQHSESTSGTIQVGADYQVSPNFLFGAFFNYTRSSASLDEEGSNSTADSYIPGLYASFAKDGWYANALAAGGINKFDVNRNIDFPGFSASTQADVQGEEEYSYISGGRDFHYQHWTFGPTAGLQYVHQTTDSFSENGAGMLDLDVASHDADSLRSRLGGRLYYAASGGGQTWRPFLDASWQHEFMQNGDSLTAGFSGGGAGAFTVPVPNNSRESALISTGMDVDIDPNTSVFTAYRFEAGSSNFFAQSVEAGFKLNF